MEEPISPQLEDTPESRVKESLRDSNAQYSDYTDILKIFSEDHIEIK